MEMKEVGAKVQLLEGRIPAPQTYPRVAVVPSKPTQEMDISTAMAILRKGVKALSDQVAFFKIKTSLQDARKAFLQHHKKQRSLRGIQSELTLNEVILLYDGSLKCGWKAVLVILDIEYKVRSLALEHILKWTEMNGNAYQYEKELFHDAQSMDDYLDPALLRKRLTVLIINSIPQPTDGRKPSGNQVSTTSLEQLPDAQNPKQSSPISKASAAPKQQKQKRPEPRENVLNPLQFLPTKESFSNLATSEPGTSAAQKQRKRKRPESRESLLSPLQLKLTKESFSNVYSEPVTTSLDKRSRNEASLTNDIDVDCGFEKGAANESTAQSSLQKGEVQNESTSSEEEQTTSEDENATENQSPDKILTPPLPTAVIMKKKPSEQRHTHKNFRGRPPNFPCNSFLHNQTTATAVMMKKKPSERGCSHKNFRGRPPNLTRHSFSTRKVSESKGNTTKVEEEMHDEWRDDCVKCNKSEPSELLCCEDCPQAYHKECLNLQAVPEDAWFCPVCTEENSTEFFNGKDFVACEKSGAMGLLGKIVLYFMKHELSEAFREPVDPSEPGNEKYRKYIQTPMDLGTIKDRIARKNYDNETHVIEDIRRVWLNCQMFNQELSAVHKSAVRLSSLFERFFQEKIESLLDAGQKQALSLDQSEAELEAKYVKNQMAADYRKQLRGKEVKKNSSQSLASTTSSRRQWI